MKEIPKTQKSEAMREKAVTLVSSLIKNDVDVGAITDRGWLRYRGIGKATRPYIKEYIKALGLYEEEKPELDVLMHFSVKDTDIDIDHYPIENKVYVKGTPLPLVGDDMKIQINGKPFFCNVTLRVFAYNDDGNLSDINIYAHKA